MKIKSYSNGPVNYHYSLNFQKWEFNIPSINFTFLTRCPGRFETAQKVANVLSGSLKRCGHIDNLARKNVAMLCGV